MTATIFTALLTLAQTDAPGRGENPSDVGGILIIVGVIVLAVLMVGSAWYFVARSTAKRRHGRRTPGREG
jgi:hypothetical protein